MTEYGSRIELVRYRLPNGKKRAVFSRYVDGAGVVFDLSVPYRFEDPYCVIESGVVDPAALERLAVDWFDKRRNEQDAEVLWMRPGFPLTSPMSSPPSGRAVPVNKGRGEPYDVYIGRGSMWGNPFSHRPSSHPGVIRVATRDAAVKRYRKWLWQQLDGGAITREELARLHGKRLGCYCKPQSCHGDVLAAAAEWAHCQSVGS